MLETTSTGKQDRMAVLDTMEKLDFLETKTSLRLVSPHWEIVPTGPPSCRGDVTVYAYDINQPSLSTALYSVLVSISVFMALSTAFYSINSPNNSVFSLCSVLLVLSTIYLFMKVSFSPDIAPNG